MEFRLDNLSYLSFEKEAKSLWLEKITVNSNAKSLLIQKRIQDCQRKKNEIHDLRFTDVFSRPNEYLKFIFYNIKVQKNTDPHWQPLYTSCPFCQMNFTIYS